MFKTFTISASDVRRLTVEHSNNFSHPVDCNDGWWMPRFARFARVAPGLQSYESRSLILLPLSASVNVNQTL